MNVTLMPSIPLKPMPQPGGINPGKPINPEKIEDFKNQLAGLQKDVSKIEPFFSKKTTLDELEGKKNPITKNIFLENLIDPEKIKDKDSEELGKKSDLLSKLSLKKIEELKGENQKGLEKESDTLSKLPSNELFLFQRELANKIGGKNDSVHSFSKVFNLEKKDKKTEIEDGGENIGNIANNNKKLEGIIKDNQIAEGSLKFTSPKELFNWISKVISKNQIKNGETLNLQIRDNNLGQFNISAQNAPKGGEINMSIVSQTKESDEFFKANEKDLIKSLETAGVKIGKIEILTAESSKSSSNGETMSENKGSLSDSINNHFDQKEQLEKDSQRRKDIWNRFRDIRES